MSSAVRRARPKGLETIAAASSSGNAPSSRPTASAWATPRSVSGESDRPWYLLCRFHSVSPWRASRSDPVTLRRRSAAQSVKHVALQWPVWDAGMIKIIFSRVCHSEALHDPPRSLIGRDRRGDNLGQPEPIEAMV
jgi:hypothetical protein